MERASCGLRLIERGMLHLERAFLWFMAYRTRNVTFGARLLWFMAYRMRNVTFGARFLWFTAYRTRNLHLVCARCGLGL